MLLYISPWSPDKETDILAPKEMQESSLSKILMECYMKYFTLGNYKSRVKTETLNSIIKIHWTKENLGRQSLGEILNYWQTIFGKY